MAYLDELDKLINEDPNEGETEGIDIYFDNLDEQTQKSVMEGLRTALNASEDDKYANSKIVESLTKTPILSIRPEELVRLLNIKI